MVSQRASPRHISEYTYLRIDGVKPYCQGRNRMERINLKAGNSSDVEGRQTFALHEIFENTCRGYLPCLWALQSIHHVTLSVTGEMQG